METDRNETIDLKEKYPDKFQELMKLYDEWASENITTDNDKTKKSADARERNNKKAKE